MPAKTSITTFFPAIATLIVLTQLAAQVSLHGNWTWMKGSDSANRPGVYGTMGVPDDANVPGARAGSLAWTDSTGIFWLYGYL